MQVATEQLRSVPPLKVVDVCVCQGPLIVAEPCCTSERLNVGPMLEAVALFRSVAVARSV